ncbi:unnamed protein product [Moneuplotes crassus]|uniref:Uncharacterized protein n=1 Tax=Euplotes crassus TaxID=5936 RepID=A0AAD1XNG2_EUPCR|nr:unnamed protein product [Moneuplotes crassus]
MLNLYHFFRPMIYGHSKITNYVFEVTTKIGAVKMIDKALMDIICSVDNLQQSKQDVNNLPPQMVKKEEEQRIPLGNLTNIVKNENASDLLVNQYMSTAFGGSPVKQEENICVNLEKSCEDWKDDDSVCSTEEFPTQSRKEIKF